MRTYRATLPLFHLDFSRLFHHILTVQRPSPFGRSFLVGGRPMVGRQTLDLLIEVRILAPQPFTRCLTIRAFRITVVLNHPRSSYSACIRSV
ncbi:protein of unknown function [Candidatus Methylomirabilis oxygeniifera]|uniref:Uncharacterized protein n=1 Tax=Methylomirabilis oxygeniifera TaxID=671143 RepID=D5MFS7_METO1|nr:protein of unknown function [Candidatus Methylomirabilis oxyfera]